MTPIKYNDLNELLAEHSKLSAEITGIESKINVASVKAAEPMLPEHAGKKARLAEIETAVRKIAMDNPELFPDEKKTHATPFGSISFRTVTSLQVDEDDETVLRILYACQAELTLAQKEKRLPNFTAEQLIRSRNIPNREALEKFSDEILWAVFAIKRKHEEKFSIKPLEVKADKLGKKQKPELREAA